MDKLRRLSTVIEESQLEDSFGRGSILWLTGYAGTGKSSLPTSYPGYDLDLFGTWDNAKWQVNASYPTATLGDSQWWLLSGICDNLKDVFAQLQASITHKVKVIAIVRPDEELIPIIQKRISEGGEVFLQSYLDDLKTMGIMRLTEMLLKREPYISEIVFNDMPLPEYEDEIPGRGAIAVRKFRGATQYEADKCALAIGEAIIKAKPSAAAKKAGLLFPSAYDCSGWTHRLDPAGHAYIAGGGGYIDPLPSMFAGPFRDVAAFSFSAHCYSASAIIYLWVLRNFPERIVQHPDRLYFHGDSGKGYDAHWSAVTWAERFAKGDEVLKNWLITLNSCVIDYYSVDISQLIKN